MTRKIVKRSTFLLGRCRKSTCVCVRVCACRRTCPRYARSVFRYNFVCACECAPLGARIRAKNNLCVRASVRLPPRPRHARSVGYVFVSACGCVCTSAPGRFSEWAPPRGRHSHWVPTHRWFSGRMLACHAGGPGSIPGRCMFCIHDPDRRSPTLLANRSTPSSASVAQWLARSAVNRKVGGSTPPGGACSFVGRPGGFHFRDAMQPPSSSGV